MSTSKFDKAIALFDLANSKDPNTEIFEDKSYPKELLYAQRMSARLEVFAPDAVEEVKLAARCQHICRWEIPRDSYEMNRAGYLTWRKELYSYHGDKAAEILEEVGYDNDTIDKVKSLLKKQQLKKNANSQLLEDIICLVFLEFYFEKFSKKYTEEKLIDIVQKTWNKMSEQGHEAALKLPYSEASLALIQKALA